MAGQSSQEQNEELRESEQLKSELVSIVSHEMRTPLASVLGFTSLLLHARGEAEDAAALPRDHRRAGHAGSPSLLDDFLDVQRIEEGRLDARPRARRRRVAPPRAGAALRAQSERHELDVVLPPSSRSTVRGDPDRLAQVVGNLLSNAIKYSPEGGDRRSRGRRAATTAYRVSVRDEGLGIPDEQQEQIFTKFFRGDAGASGIAGSGLGLAIARSLVEAHGGTIDFQSASGEGSIFWLELPIAANDR